MLAVTFGLPVTMTRALAGSVAVQGRPSHQASVIPHSEAGQAHFKTCVNLVGQSGNIQPVEPSAYRIPDEIDKPTAIDRL